MQSAKHRNAEIASARRDSRKPSRRATRRPAAGRVLASRTRPAPCLIRDYEVTFAEAPADVAGAIDAAYDDKYPGSPAVRNMQGDGPRSATVVITPRR